MNLAKAKPKLLYFQYQYDSSLPAFLMTHKHEHVKCLSQFFDVTVIHEDCDYGQVCEEHEPELVMFEGGVPNPACRRPRIGNVRACPNIPKLGFLHADGFSAARAGFLSDMDHRGVETFFAIATTAPEQMPDVADRMFIWPNFVDPEVFRDYGQHKNIPVLFTGNTNVMYPWRHKIIGLVAKHYSSLICPHPGYAAARRSDSSSSNPKGIARIAVGETYARMLNASWCVPACGAVAKEVVRKHLEIPACRAALIAEESAALKAAGFVDMVNCVFADEHDVLDKLDFLFNNPDRLKQITDCGHDLVHSRHTLQHRSQILQWLALHESLKPGDKIVQDGPFDGLRTVESSQSQGSSHVRCHGIHLELLREGDKALGVGNYDEAERLYLKSSSFIPYMPEPKFRLALCNLYKGDAKSALFFITEPIEFTLADYKAVDPDPVEWAYYVICLLCLGKTDEAVRRANEFPWLHHPELDRTRWALWALRSSDSPSVRIDTNSTKNRSTLHLLPTLDFETWMAQLCNILRRCGRDGLAKNLEVAAKGADQAEEKQKARKTGSEDAVPVSGLSFLGIGSRSKMVALVRNDAYGFFGRQRVYSRAKAFLQSSAKKFLHRMELKHRYFLPYHLSASRNDEFFRILQELIQDEDVKRLLVIGARPGRGSTQALLAGAASNKHKPPVFCLGYSRSRLIPEKNARYDNARWYELSSDRNDGLANKIRSGIDRIKEENGVDCFDVLLIDGSELCHEDVNLTQPLPELQTTSLVVLQDMSTAINHSCLSCLLKDSAYSMVACNPGLRNGYSIFKRNNPKASGNKNLVRAAVSEEC